MIKKYVQWWERIIVRLLKTFVLIFTVGELDKFLFVTIVLNADAIEGERRGGNIVKN